MGMPKSSPSLSFTFFNSTWASTGALDDPMGGSYLLVQKSKDEWHRPSYYGKFGLGGSAAKHFWTFEYIMTRIVNEDGTPTEFWQTFQEKGAGRGPTRQTVLTNNDLGLQKCTAILKIFFI